MRQALSPHFGKILQLRGPSTTRVGIAMGTGGSSFYRDTRNGLSAGAYGSAGEPFFLLICDFKLLDTRNTV